MLDTRPFPGVPQMGLHRTFHYDDVTDQFHIETHYVDDQEGRNTEFNSHGKGRRFGEDRTVARIPNTVLMKLNRDGILRDEKRFARWLDTDGIRYRVFPGSLSR